MRSRSRRFLRVGRSDVPRVPPRRPPGGRYRDDNDTEPKHRQAHEFENQSVHEKIPQANRKICWEAIERLLRYGGRTSREPSNVSRKVNDLRPAKGLEYLLMRLGRIGVVRECRLLFVGLRQYR
jgi:hypothetical protein